MPPTVARPPHSIGLYLAVVQFFLALGWIVYAVYLPQLAQRAGIAAQWVPWLLLADQLVFLVADLLVGVASDRAARVLGRISHAVLAATLLSTLAFVLLPWVAPQGSPALFIGLTFVWAVTSSALRAPPLTLLGRYVARPAQPMMIALGSFGLGLASAAAPYLGLQLKTIDPTWPFLLSALGLAAVTLGMAAAERSLARGAGSVALTAGAGSVALTAGAGSVALTAGAGSVALTAGAGSAALTAGAGGAAVPASAAAAIPRLRSAHVGIFLAASAVGAAAFQWHSFVASAPLALRFASSADLPWLLPVFWVGFNLALVPAGWFGKRWGALPAMLLGAAMATLGSAAASLAATLGLLLAAQALAGAGWALLLCSAFGGALALGSGGREGLMSGALSSTLALAALLRIGFVASTTPKAALVLDLAWLAAMGFAVCALLLFLRRRSAAG